MKVITLKEPLESLCVCPYVVCVFQAFRAAFSKGIKKDCESGGKLVVILEYLMRSELE
jgi:hypothetical protein